MVSVEKETKVVYKITTEELSKILSAEITKQLGENIVVVGIEQDLLDASYWFIKTG